jgi:hypothetical protein
MRITRRSLFTGKDNVMEIPVTADQLQNWMDGTLIQFAMPHLSPDQREFLKTGVTPSEWAAAFPVEE